ncbi:MAG: TIGR03435 family protein, partial [Vicinamibacterales bacterium]
VKAREDGRLGPGLVPSTVDCAAMMRAARPAGGPPGAPPPAGPLPFAPPKPGERPTCGVMMGPGRLSAGGWPIGNVLGVIEGQAGRIVIDRTGLTGNFDLDLTWTPDFMANLPAGAAGAPTTIFGQAIDPNGPSLATAIQEQLGLKLEATKAPVEVLVIDSVSRPTPD